MTEEWRPVVGYEGLYEVSNTGFVKNVKRGKLLRPSFDKNGYLKCVLSKNGKQRTIYVHRLVAQAFLENPMYLEQVNHKDEDKSNNRVDNLEWCTARYNVNYGSSQEKRIQTNIEKGHYIRVTDRKEYMKEYKKRYYEKNKDKIKEYKKRYYEENKDKWKEYYEENKEKRRDYMKEYWRRKKEK